MEPPSCIEEVGNGSEAERGPMPAAIDGPDLWPWGSETGRPSLKKGAAPEMEESSRRSPDLEVEVKDLPD
jgi:hypothetical protein